MRGCVCVVWCLAHVWNVMVEALLAMRGYVCRVVSDASVECDGGGAARCEGMSVSCGV